MNDKVSMPTPTKIAVSAPATKKYQFPSAPCTFCMSNGKKILAHDGTYETSDPDEIKELDATVETGGIYPYTGKVGKSQIPPPPVGADKQN